MVLEAWAMCWGHMAVTLESPVHLQSQGGVELESAMELSGPGTQAGPAQPRSLMRDSGQGRAPGRPAAA